MGKKNKGVSVNSSAVNQEVEAEVVKTPVEAEPEKIEEVPAVEEPVPVVEEPEVIEQVETPEVITEEKEAEAKEEEMIGVEASVAEEPVAEVKDDDPEPVPDVVEKAAPVIEEPAPTTDNIKVSTDEEPLGPVDYFVQINKESVPDSRLAVIEKRLDKYGLARFVTADGIVLVGPYVTKDGAINGRRLVIRSGLKGEIVEIPKD